MSKIELPRIRQMHRNKVHTSYYLLTIIALANSYALINQYG
jgi:hypothetical protein